LFSSVILMAAKPPEDPAFTSSNHNCLNADFPDFADSREALVSPQRHLNRAPGGAVIGDDLANASSEKSEKSALSSCFLVLGHKSEVLCAPTLTSA
jgi:hypothetical protein